MVLRTAGRASHPATVRGAGACAGGPRSGCSVSRQASGTFWHRRRAGRGNFLLPSRWSRSQGAVKRRERLPGWCRWELAGSADSPAPPGVVPRLFPPPPEQPGTPCHGPWLPDSISLAAPWQRNWSQKLRGQSLNRL